MPSIYIDSDNALGSPLGDVDDAFAIAALLRSGLHVNALGSVFGNTSEKRAANNNERLARLCDFKGPLLRGAAGAAAHETEAAKFMLTASSETRLAMLGPLTNLVLAVRAKRSFEEVVIVGSNSSSRGRIPPWWPHEFNLTCDRAAAREVFDSALPLTIVPLNVLPALMINDHDLRELSGLLGAHLRRHSRRWEMRVRVVKLAARYRLPDLVAAIYLLEPSLYDIERTTAVMRRSTFIDYGAGERPVKLVRDFDGKAVWRKFVSIMSAQ